MRVNEGDEAIALLAALVIDGTGAPPIRDAAILIRAGRIVAVGPRQSTLPSEEIETHDLGALTIMPGLVDHHVHLSFAFSHVLRGDFPDAAAIDAVLSSILDHGVTTIYDLGGPFPWTLELARSIERGERTGPTIRCAGPIITAVGGHPAGTLLAGNARAAEASTRQISTPQEAHAVVRTLAASGVDVIKVVFDSGRTAEGFGRGVVPILEAPVLQAIVAEGRAAGLPVTVHWGNVSELPQIIAARPTSIEHAGYEAIPEEIVSSIAAAHIDLDATLSVLAAHLPQDVLRNGPFENVRNLARAGVTIKAGTDAPLRGLKLGESLHRELELLVEAGLSTTQALSAATSPLVPGARADLIAVAGDPITSISSVRSVRMVMCAGRWAKRYPPHADVP
jgi:imidazolonepropionase-like amidohydrolase